jgi:hypothetical protein
VPCQCCSLFTRPVHPPPTCIPTRYPPLPLLVDAAVDLRDLPDPPAAVRVFQIHDLVLTPVKVIRDKGYLLDQPVERVA